MEYDEVERDKNYPMQRSYPMSNDVGDRRKMADLLDEANSQSEKLIQMINELASALEPIRQDSDETVALDASRDLVMKSASPVRYGSPWARRLDDSIQLTKLAQARINKIMSDLDV